MSKVAWGLSFWCLVSHEKIPWLHVFFIFVTLTRFFLFWTLLRWGFSLIFSSGRRWWRTLSKRWFWRRSKRGQLSSGMCSLKRCIEHIICLVVDWVCTNQLVPCCALNKFTAVLIRSGNQLVITNLRFPWLVHLTQFSNPHCFAHSLLLLPMMFSPIGFFLLYKYGNPVASNFFFVHY